MGWRTAGEGDDRKRRRGQGRETKGEGGREGGAWGREEGRGIDRGDKSPAWSSQDLGSTDLYAAS